MPASESVRLGARETEAALATRLGASEPGAPVVWALDGHEVVVHTDTVEVRLLESALVVAVELESDETGRAALVTAFELGCADREQADLIAVTPALPDGPPALAARWGRTLQDALWAGLLGLVEEHACSSGGAPRGLALRAGALELHAEPPVKEAAAR